MNIIAIIIDRYKYNNGYLEAFLDKYTKSSHIP